MVMDAFSPYSLTYFLQQIGVSAAIPFFVCHVFLKVQRLWPLGGNLFSSSGDERLRKRVEKEKNTAS